MPLVVVDGNGDVLSAFGAEINGMAQIEVKDRKGQVNWYARSPYDQNGLRAAECVFDRAIKGIELEDIEARLTELERAADAGKGGTSGRERWK